MLARLSHAALSVSEFRPGSEWSGGATPTTWSSWAGATSSGVAKTGSQLAVLAGNGARTQPLIDAFRWRISPRR